MNKQVLKGISIRQTKPIFPELISFKGCQKQILTPSQQNSVARYIRLHSPMHVQIFVAFSLVDAVLVISARLGGGFSSSNADFGAAKFRPRTQRHRPPDFLFFRAALDTYYSSRMYFGKCQSNSSFVGDPIRWQFLALTLRLEETNKGSWRQGPPQENTFHQYNPWHAHDSLITFALRIENF